MEGKQIMIGGVVLAAAAFGLKVWFGQSSTTQPTAPQPAFDQGNNNAAPPQPQVNTTTPQQGGVQQWQPQPAPVMTPQSHGQSTPYQPMPVAVGETFPPSTTQPTLQWDVVIDPPIEPVVYSGLDKLKIAMPDKTGDRDILFPEGHSPYVALGSDRAAKGNRVVWDLRDTKKRAGAVLEKQFNNNPVALSQNGAFLALYTLEVKQTVTAPAAPVGFRGGISAPSVQTQTVSVIEVHDVAAKKRLGSLTMANSGGNTQGTMTTSTPRPALLAFCGNEYLLAATDDGATTVWEMPSGLQARSFTLPNMRDAETSASPGGRYLAIARGARGGSSAMMSSGSSDGELLSVYDVVSGQLAGQAKLPANGICVALSFSPDGEELAALYRETRGSKLVVVSVADGTVALETELPRVSVPNSTNANGPMLQWFPNRERWLLFGQLLLSRESGEATRLPNEKGVSSTGLCRVLDDTHVLRVFGDKGKYNLKAVELAGGDAAE